MKLNNEYIFKWYLRNNVFFFISGRHFGMLTMKSILANILRNYKIKSHECDRLKIEILLFPVSGHFISIEKRQ